MYAYVFATAICGLTMWRGSLYHCFVIKSNGLRSRYSITVAMIAVDFLGALIDIPEYITNLD